MATLNETQRKDLLSAIEFLNDVHVAKQVKLSRQLQGQLWPYFEERHEFTCEQGGKLVFRVPFHEYESRLFKAAENAKKTNPSVKQSQKPVEISANEIKSKGRGKGKNPAKKVTSIALDDDLIQALTERGVREERTVSALIRLAIKHYLECVK